MATTVFVSGASGYIAQHIIKLLIEKGYDVVGTVRSPEKGDNLKKNLGSNKFSYEIVKDIAAPNAFDEALAKHPEVTVFLHTASPFHFNVTDVKKELLDPAIEGTKNALSSIKKHGPQIKRVVVTSSYAAVMSLRPEDKHKLLTEETWNPITYEESLENPLNGYFGSKKFAEKAAWDFVETEKPNFILNTVNPAYVFGPQAFDSEVSDVLNTSSEIINSAVQSKPGDDAPGFAGRFVDVRDVAKFHLIAFESDVQNFRFLLSLYGFFGQDILDVINENFPELKGKIATGTPGAGKALSKDATPVDVSKTAAYLDKWIELEQSVVDSVSQILNAKK